MTTTRPTIRNVPSASPADEAELAAWKALTRGEQVERYRDLFQHPDCNTFTSDTPDQILAAARLRAAARRAGQLQDRWIEIPPVGTFDRN